ncbi:MAG TPA: signal recognition particle-docking protein FtsY [Methanocorpusculum sp.]|nr:signal recognition particle-docking protein FtsY [Methanocorpusculum sp.]
MFEALKKKLGIGKRKEEEPVSAAEPASEVAAAVYEAPVSASDAASDASAPADMQAAPAPASVPAPPASSAEEPDEEEHSGGVLAKLKSLVVDHQVTLSDKAIDDALFDLQMVLLESDVAYPVAEAITEHMKEELSGSKKKVFSSSERIVTDALKHAIESVLGSGFDLVSYINTHEKPVKILFTGVNGTGKTTSVAKIAAYLQSQGLSVVVGAGDTFRAGAIEQIRVHCDRLGIKLIAHQEGADPSAVLFDTVEYAKAHKTDVVLADSAGRFHNRTNLMNQLDKIKRVMKPDLVFYVDEAVAGNDAVIRAEEFEKTVSTDGVILTKVDMDPKGGAAISIAYTIGKPLVFLGVGQEYTDMKPFTPSLIIDEIFGEEK